jgi:hypothetical protein
MRNFYDKKLCHGEIFSAILVVTLKKAKVFSVGEVNLMKVSKTSPCISTETLTRTRNLLLN